MTFRALLIAAALAVATLVRPAAAAPYRTVIADTTDDIAYQGTHPTGYFDGSDRGDVIGVGFDTSQITVTETPLAGGALAVDFKLTTRFSGTDCFAGICARYADLFLRMPAQGYSGAGFNYAVALGGQTPNGGIGAAGLYTVSGYKTSRDIWAARTDFIYGGAYTNDAGTIPAELAPTVLTAGTQLAAATVDRMPDGADEYILDVNFSVGPAESPLFLDGFDVLWGTGDCANDTVFGSVAAVPEPATLAVLAAGLAILAVARRLRASPRARR